MEKPKVQRSDDVGLNTILLNGPCNQVGQVTKWVIS